MVFSPPSVSIIQLYPNAWCLPQLIEFCIFGFSKWDFVFICFKVFNILSFKIAFADTVKEQQTRKKFFFTNQRLVSRQINGYKSSPFSNHKSQPWIIRNQIWKTYRFNVSDCVLDCVTTWNTVLCCCSGVDGLGDRFEIYLAEWLNDDEISQDTETSMSLIILCIYSIKSCWMMARYIDRA